MSEDRRHPCPLIVVRTPGAAVTVDHLVVEQEATALLTGGGRDVLGLCGEMFTPTSAFAWQHPICRRCLGVLHGLDLHPGRHRMYAAANPDANKDLAMCHA